MISAGWLLAFIVGALLIYFEKTPDEPHFLCLVFTERFNTYYVLTVTFTLVIPALLAVVFIYCRIYQVIMDGVMSWLILLEEKPPKCANIFFQMDTKVLNERMDKLRKIVLRSESQNGPPNDKSERHREIRTTVIIFVTVILYAICWIPGIILLFYLLLAPESVSVTGILVVYILNHINSAIDPFLYAYNLKGARGAVRRLIRRTTWISGTSASTSQS